MEWYGLIGCVIYCRLLWAVLYKVNEIESIIEEQHSGGQERADVYLHRVGQEAGFHN